MAEFNAMDTAAFKGVWVFCEQREGEIQSISYQLLSEGRKLANDLGVELAGVVMGSGLAEADLKTLGGYGADRVYNIDSPLLKDYTTDGYAKALCDLIMDKKPEIMLIGATNLGRGLGPRCADARVACLVRTRAPGDARVGERPRLGFRESCASFARGLPGTRAARAGGATFRGARRAPRR